MSRSVLLIFFKILAYCGICSGQEDTIVSAYPSGNIKEQYVVINGQKNGPYTFFYENGTIWQTGNYKNDRLESKWLIYNQKGTIKQIANYSEGKREGKQSFYYENGMLMQQFFCSRDSIEGMVEIYSDIGYLVERIQHKNNKKHGEYIKLNEFGDTVVFGRFQENLKSGIWKEFYPNGSIAKLTIYQNDTIFGCVNYYDDDEQLRKRICLHPKESQLTFYPNGSIESTLRLNNGIADGFFTSYHENGLLKSKGLYTNNKKVGNWSYFHLNGSFKAKGIYEKDEPKGQWDFYNPEGDIIRSITY